MERAKRDHVHGHRATRRLFSVLAVAAAIALPAPATADVPRDFYGVVTQDTLSGADYAQMRDGRVGTLRFLLPWAHTEPRPGEYDWTESDAIVRGAAEAGAKPFPFVAGSTPWIADQPWRAPFRREERRAWKRFLRALVDRYGPDGDFWQGVSDPDPIRRWQIWNEPSFPRYWQPKPNPPEYAKLLKASAKAIRGRDPEAEIVLGGLPPTRRGIMPGEFLRRLYRVHGIKRRFDAVAVHPYAPNRIGLRQRIAEVRNAMVLAGDGHTPLYVTEIGWASDGESGHALVHDPEGQARMLRNAFRFLRERRREWRIGGVQWYSWRDTPGPPVETECDFCQYSGLFTADGAPKPAWTDFKRFTAP